MTDGFVYTSRQGAKAAYAAAGGPVTPLRKARGPRGRQRAARGRWTIPLYDGRAAVAAGEIGRVERFSFYTSTLKV